MRSGPAAAAPRSRSSRIPLHLRHFLFDLDGTLVDSGDDLAAATNAALSECGLDELERGAVLDLVGNGVVRLVEASIERVAPGRPSALLEPALAAFRRFYAAHLLDRTRPYPGIAATLDALAARGTSLSLLTNKPRGFTRAILEGVGLARHFRQRVCGDDDLPRKPDPAGVARLLHEIGAARLEAVLVGDSPIDVATARAAGVASCAVGWGFSAPDALLAAAPDHLIREPAQLLDLCAAR